MNKQMTFNKLAVMLLCICMLIPSTLELSSEQASNIQVDALGNPIDDKSGFSPLIDPPPLTSPIYGAHTGDDTPLLDWEFVTYAVRYKIQVDNNYDFTSIEYEELTNIGTGDVTEIETDHLFDDKYYWRVRAYNVFFDPSEWSDIWSFTVDTVNPGTPTLSEPSYGELLMDNTPWFNWVNPGDADGYLLMVADNGAFTNPDIMKELLVSCYTCPSALSDDTYYWKVQARDKAYNWGDFSSRWTFTVDTVAPNAPVLVSPANGALIDDNTPYLDWNPSSTATLYNIQVDDSSSFTSPEVDENTASTYYTSSALSETTYYWRVRARDAAGNWGSYCSAWHFTVDTIAPGIPTLSTPTNGAVINDQTPYLDWSSVSTATQYNVQVDNNADFSSLEVDSNPSSSSYTCTTTLSDATYYWRVCARDATGNWGDWSAVWHFEIDSTPPATLTLLSPSNNTIDNDPTPYLEWSSVSSAVLYQVQVANYTDFLHIIVDLETVDTDYITDILADSTYYWRVRAKDAAENWGDWSDVWNFQIDTLAPTITTVENDPTIPTDADSVIFSCDVSDLNGIDLVVLHYRINSGVWSDVTMALVSGTTYQVSLGPFAYNDLIEYNISAFDTSINSNEAMNDNGGLYYSFTVVSSDVTGPTINAIYNDPTNPTDADTVAIYCNVTDINGIQSVTLYYRVNGGSWLSMSMTQVGTLTYKADIGPFAYDDSIEYYIIAIDDSPNNNEATADNSGSYYSFIISCSDVTGPIIDSVEHSPTNPLEGQTVTISCSVTDSSGVQFVMLNYRVIGTLWTNISMVLATGDTYEANIGPFDYDALVEYYITAVDNSPIDNEATNDNSGVNYNFSIGESDETGPTISSIAHTPSTPNATETVTISCSVVDTSGIQVVTLSYRVNSGSWTSVSMSLDSGDTYVATIGTFNADDIIEYYVSATDDSPNSNVATDDNNGNYYSFTVETPTTSTTPPTSNTSLVLLLPLIGALLATIIIRKRKN